MKKYIFTKWDYTIEIFANNSTSAELEWHELQQRKYYPTGKKWYAVTQSINPPVSGIVSEIRIATITSSDNKYINYPCIVCIHVIERNANGGINVATVSTGGCFVTAKNALFSQMSDILPFKYQECSPAFVLNWYRNRNI